MADRIVRISEEVKKEISNIIQNEIKDPRLPTMVSIIACEVSKDLSHAKVYVSVLGDADEKKNAMKALKSASGFIRRLLGHRVQLRATPEIHFELDTSIEHGIHINKLIDDAKKEFKE
ncbi:MAG TPA: 30S ribosome-binding factor RbfA [Ruminiclostridium sp.]